MTEAVQTSASVRTHNKNVRVRKNIRTLSDRELNDLRNAYEGLYKVSADGGNNDERGYQWIAGVHGLPTPTFCQHGNDNFPTWHRAYIYEFELRLQEQVPSVMLPYWDWTSDQSIGQGMPKACTDETYVDLGTGETKPNPLYSAYSQVQDRNTVRSPSPPSQLQRLKSQVDLAERQQTYDRFSPALEQPHGGLHLWVGGDMGQVPVAAYDPIFWLHHCNVDRQWNEWQRQRGNSTVPQGVLDFVCAPFTYTGGQTLDTQFFGYTYVEGEAFAAVDMAEAQKPGENNEIHLAIPNEQPEFKHAFLELHGVSKTVESYHLNVYLGDGKGANSAYEPNVEAGYAASVYMFGHGECAGGEGHCQYKARPYYDRRPPHHLAPYNTYVDITEALRNYSAVNGQVPICFKVYDTDGNPVKPEEIDFEGASIVTHL